MNKKELEDYRARNVFLRRAVIEICNHIPDPHLHETEPDWKSDDPNKVHFYAGQALSHGQPLTPLQKQSLQRRAVWLLLSDDRDRREFLKDPLRYKDTVYTHSPFNNPQCRYPLTLTQELLLREKALAYEDFLRWQKSPERVIEEIHTIRDEAIAGMELLCESYRFTVRAGEGDG